MEEKKNSFSVALKVVATTLVAQEFKKCPITILDLKVVGAIFIGVIKAEVCDADAYDVAFVNYYSFPEVKTIGIILWVVW